MKNKSGTMVLAALIALSFTALGNVSYAGKTKEEKQIAKAERLLQKAEKADARAEKKRARAESIIKELEVTVGINPGGSGNGGGENSVIDSPHCGGPGQPLC